MNTLLRVVPLELREAAESPEARGFVEKGWYIEETHGAVRQSFRVTEKLHEEHSPYQKINIYEFSFFGKLMTLNDIVMLTERDEFVYHEMLVHVPLCSIQNPRRVLIIGGGDCGCMREVLKHESVQEVVQVDIDQRVTEVSREFFPWVEATLNDPRTTPKFEDGVRYIEAHPSSFDLIIVDGTDPEGFALNLFLSDFYRQVARALRPGGVMTAQTESPHWSAPVVSSIYGELRDAFESVHAYLASIPTYASGLWTLAYAGAKPRPVDLERASRITRQCRYYNPAVHEAAFALPNFVREAISAPR